MTEFMRNHFPAKKQKWHRRIPTMPVVEQARPTLRDPLRRV